MTTADDSGANKRASDSMLEELRVASLIREASKPAQKNRKGRKGAPTPVTSEQATQQTLQQAANELVTNERGRALDRLRRSR